MIYGYLRVSSDDQTVLNQKEGVVAFASVRGWKIDAYILDEGISGTKDPDKRNLGMLLKKVQTGDTIICSEISRLGRNLMMVMSILEMLMKRNCKLYTVKDNYELGNNIQSTVLAFAFGLSAQIERDMISMRTKEALARKKAQGIILGRPIGRRNAPEKHKLFRKQALIQGLLDEGVSKRKIANICKVDRNTLARYINSEDYGIIH